MPLNSIGSKRQAHSEDSSEQPRAKVSKLDSSASSELATS